jgi:hypothetical protein
MEADTPSNCPYLYFLREHYLWKGNPCGLTKSNLYFFPDSKCRAAIYVSLESGLMFHSLLSSQDCATCSVEIEGEKVFFYSVYLDCHKTVEEAAWLRSIIKASSSKRHYIAGINTNLHSDVWGTSTDRRGRLLEELLFQHNLCVLNKGTSPTFETSRAATCIDITVASPALASTINKN